MAGTELAIVFQDALTALNPLYTVGTQLAEPFRIHHGMSAKEAKAQGRRADGPRRHPAARDPAELLPAPVLRRHAPAAAHRDGRGAEPERADRRRAHHRARRHRAGPDHGAAARPAHRVPHGRRADHPRPGAGRRGGRPRRGDVRRQHRRNRPGRRGFRQPASTPTPRACWTRCPSTLARGDELKSIGGSPPDLHAIPDGLRLPGPLPAGPRRLRDQAARRSTPSAPAARPPATSPKRSDPD